MSASRSVIEALARSGFHLPDPSRPEVNAELVRVAGALLQRGCRNVGLLPASDDVAIPGVALQLALAMAQLAGSPTEVIDASGTWCRSDADLLAHGGLGS